MKRKYASAWLAVFHLGAFALAASGQSLSNPPLPAVSRSQWRLVETPMQYVQYAPYETKTWTFRHPGAESIKVRFDSVNLLVQGTNGCPEPSYLEILNRHDQVVQTIAGMHRGAFDTVAVPGNCIKVRYVNQASGEAGVLFAGQGDQFCLAGYKYERSSLYSEAAGAPLNYQIASPLPLSAQPYMIYRYNRCEIPLAVKKPFNWGAQDATQYKMDFFLDGCFVGSSSGYGIAGDGNSIYFGVQLDLAQWLTQHNGKSSTLCIRETRYVPDSLTAWRTECQYLKLPMTLADDRQVYTTNMTLEAVSSVTNVGRWFYVPNWSMMHAAAQWGVGGGSPGVDVRLHVYNESQQVLASSYHPGVNQNSGNPSIEGVSLWLSPGYYRVEMSRTGGSCVGFGYTAWLKVCLDPQSDILYY
ncbi:MAG TPA: hypothetical protein DCZ95_03890 [Verrucomicrobia bacterium]|nr:hypothetical protein [Verrucomicrobiota bacterium]